MKKFWIFMEFMYGYNWKEATEIVEDRQEKNAAQRGSSSLSVG